MGRILLVISMLAALVMFQNCGKVSFDSSNGGSSVDKSSSDGSGDELGDKIPVSDLVNDETEEVMTEDDLFEVYPCGNDKEKKIYICHYPQGELETHHTLCVGAPAVAAHVDHHDKEGAVDYVGPCQD